MTAASGPAPRYRTHTGPPLFRQGFRPFFLGAALWAVLSLGLWIALLTGSLGLPTGFGALAWHVHEMLFGFVCAVIAGFLLTAIPNWTGRMPLSGLPLAVLFGTWLAGRAAMSMSAAIGLEIAAAVDLSFLALLLAAVSREIVAGRNWRNLPMVAAVASLLAANALTHAEALGLPGLHSVGNRLAIAVVTLLIALVGGRIVPSFTRNWLAKRRPGGLPAPFGPFDRLCLLAIGAALGVWTIWPNNRAGGVLLLVGGALGFLRLARWRGDRTLAEPLVWSLHLGYAWMPAGLVLSGLAIVSSDVTASGGLHALTAGAMGSMTLAVMTRATLGHTGRPLRADMPTTLIYLLVFVGAALRVAAAFDPAGVPFIVDAAAACWGGAFGLFVLAYGRRLVAA